MLKEIFKRISEKTPKFFKQLRVIAIAIGSLSTLVVTSGLAIPDTYLFIVGQAGIVAGIVGAFLASLTVEDSTKI